jgi:hypothetical protein
VMWWEERPQSIAFLWLFNQCDNKLQQ